MQKERLMNLFETFDPAVRNLILSVLDFEQENISKDMPRYKEQIDEIVIAAAKRALDKQVDEERP